MALDRKFILGGDQVRTAQSEQGPEKPAMDTVREIFSDVMKRAGAYAKEVYLASRAEGSGEAVVGDLNAQETAKRAPEVEREAEASIFEMQQRVANAVEMSRDILLQQDISYNDVKTNSQAFTHLKEVLGKAGFYPFKAELAADIEGGSDLAKVVLTKGESLNGVHLKNPGESAQAHEATIEPTTPLARLQVLVALGAINREEGNRYVSKAGTVSEEDYDALILATAAKYAQTKPGNRNEYNVRLPIARGDMAGFAVEVSKLKAGGIIKAPDRLKAQTVRVLELDFENALERLFRS